MVKRFFSIGFFTAMLAQASLAAVVINVNSKDGDTISGDHQFKITVESTNLVTNVEFYIGDNLTGTDESTPYTFDVDTLAQKEGDFVVTFAAYTNEGESAKKTLRLKIDNGIGKGVAFHVQAGTDALVVRKWDDAIKSARVALKIDPKDNSARLLMARANFGKGVLDLAQKFAEDVTLDQPTNRQALDLLSAIGLQRAFNAFNSSRDQKTTLATMTEAMKKAAESRRASLDTAVDAFGPQTDSNAMAYADIMIDSGRYSLAIKAMQPIFDKSQSDPAVANRLIFAKIRAGRIKDAAATMEMYRRFGKPDGYGFILKAIIDQFGNNLKASEESEKEALLNDPTNIGVRFGQAYLALVRDRTSAFSQIILDLDKTEGASAITNNYLSARAFLMNDYEEARKRFEQALLAEPASYDTYVERANQTIAGTFGQNLNAEQTKLRYDFAQAYLEAGLAAKPESFEVLTGLCIIHIMAGRQAEAVRFGTAAVGAGPEYGPAHYALAGAYRMARRSDDARKAMEAGTKIDSRLGGRPSPSGDVAWQFFYKNGRIPYLPAPRNAE